MVLCEHNVLQKHGKPAKELVSGRFGWSQRFKGLKSSHWNVTSNLRGGIPNIGQQQEGPTCTQHTSHRFTQTLSTGTQTVQTHPTYNNSYLRTVLSPQWKSRRKHDPPTARKCQWNKPECLDAKLLGRVQSQAFITYTAEEHMTYQTIRNDPECRQSFPNKPTMVRLHPLTDLFLLIRLFVAQFHCC